MKEDVIFLLGASGYFGSELLNAFSTVYHKIYIGTRDLNSNKYGSNISPVYCDLKGEINIPEDVNIIINCAGIINDKFDMYEVNQIGVGKLCKIAFERNIVFIQLSSVGVYGRDLNKIVDESFECMPENEYERTKYEAELIIENYFTLGMKGYILQPSIIFGKKRFNGVDSFSQLIIYIKNGYFIRIGDGSGVYNLVHINEIINAIFLLLNSKCHFGNKYILNQSITFSDFSNIVLKDSNVKIKSIPKFVIYFIAKVMTFLEKITNKSLPFNFKKYSALVNKTRYSQKKIEKEQNYKISNSLENYISNYLKEFD